MKTALIMSEDLVKDTQKIAFLANKELSKQQDKNTTICNKINKEIEILIKRKECSIKYRKELEAREKLWKVKDNYTQKKLSL